MSNQLILEEAKLMDNPLDLIKHFKPDWTDEQCDFYIWEYTCYPFDLEETVKQLNEQLL